MTQTAVLQQDSNGFTDMQYEGLQESDALTEQILRRLDVLDNRLETLNSADSRSDDADLSYAVESQSSAIRSLADAFAQLQESLPQIVKSAVESHSSSDVSEPDAYDDSDSAEADAAADESDEPEAAETEAAAGSPMDAWSQIKNAFLSGEGGDQPEAEAKAETPADEPLQPEEQADDEPETPDPGLESLLSEIPTLAEPDDLAEEQLRNAVIDRDRFISTLAGRLQGKLRRFQPMTSEQLRELSESASDDLKQRIEQTLESLDAQVRLGELELSLERARIGRQVVTLEATKEKLQATARRMGLTVREDGSLEGEVNAKGKGSKGRRWLGAMGFGD